MKQSAFVFPITLFALLLIAGFSIAAFSLQQIHVNFLQQQTSSSSREIRIDKLSENNFSYWFGGVDEAVFGLPRF